MRTGHGITALLAALALAGALGNAGCSKAPETAQETTAQTETPAPPAAGGEATVVEMTVDGGGFHPDRVPAKAGQPVTLAITRTTDETCGTEIVIPAHGINTKLPLNERVEVTLTPAASGEIAFACGMDMMKGTIVAD
jgi:plastocyanin